MNARFLRLRIFLLALLGFIYPLSISRCQDAPEENVNIVPPDGTEVFRSALNDENIQPLERFGDIQTDPKKTIIILLGEESIRRYLSIEVEQAARNGAAVLIATDRSTARTPLRRLFGLDISGETVHVPRQDAFLGEPYWPWVRPKIPRWKAAAKGSLDEVFQRRDASGRNGVATCMASVASRTWLPDGKMTPLEALAGYPLPAETLRRGKLDAGKEFFAVGGPWGKGQVLVLADHSLFCNILNLTDENANTDFTIDLIRWMKTSGEEPRTRCLFVEDGKIQNNFEPPSPEIPFPVKFNFAVEIMNSQIPQWQEDDALNGKLFEFLGSDGITWRSALRFIMAMTSIGLVLYFFIKMVRAQARADPARRLVTAEIAAMIPRGGVLRQRFDSQLDHGNVYEMARQRVRAEFAELEADPDPEGRPPVVRVQNSYTDPHALRKMILRLWGIGYGGKPVRVTPQYWYRILDDLDEVLRAHDDRFWIFEPAANYEAGK